MKHMNHHAHLTITDVQFSFSLPVLDGNDMGFTCGKGTD